MKKKTIILLLCFIVLFSFVSCKKGNEEAVTDKAVNQEMATTTETTTNTSKTTEVKADVISSVDNGSDMAIENNQDNIEQPEAEAVEEQMNSYEFTLMNANVNVTLDNGVATIDYPSSLTKEEIGSGLSYIELILDLNPSDFSFAFSNQGEVIVTYPKTIADKDLIEGFKIGLEYYMPYADYKKYNFDLYGLPVYVGIKSGEAVIIYPKNITKNEVSGLLDMMESNEAAAGFDYTILADRVVSITYPSQIEESALIDGFVALLNDTIPKYLSSEEMANQPAAPENAVEEETPATEVKAISVEPKEPAQLTKEESKKEFVKNYKDFEFYVGDVHVDGMVSEKDVVFKYDSAFFDKNLENELLKIASTMTAYKASDFTYKLSEGQLMFTYSEDIDPNEAIDAFFAEIFSL